MWRMMSQLLQLVKCRALLLKNPSTSDNDDDKKRKGTAPSRERITMQQKLKAIQHLKRIANITFVGRFPYWTALLLKMKARRDRQ